MPLQTPLGLKIGQSVPDMASFRTNMTECVSLSLGDQMVVATTVIFFLLLSFLIALVCYCNYKFMDRDRADYVIDDTESSVVTDSHQESDVGYEPLGEIQTKEAATV